MGKKALKGLLQKSFCRDCCYDRCIHAVSGMPNAMGECTSPPIFRIFRLQDEVTLKVYYVEWLSMAAVTPIQIKTVG